jgi:diguanylate cyclase (GGDEF)-like protein
MMQQNPDKTFFWKEALGSAGQGVWDYDVLTGRRDHSDTWHHIRGLKPGVHITTTDEEWLEVIHPDDRELAQDQTNRLNAGELAEIAYEYRERHADGHWIWIMCRGRAVEWDENGKPSRFVGTDTDITRIKASEDQVKAMSRRLELALSSVQMGVWRYDVTRDTVEWDDRLRSIYGLAPGATVPRGIWESALHPDDYDAATAVAQVGLTMRRDHEISYRIIRPDGQVRFIQSRVSYQEDLFGGPIMVGINWDATEEHDRSVALETAHRLAAARNAELEAARAEMEHIALHDMLTGLPNRRKLDAVQRDFSAQGNRQTRRSAILHIDLDRFKQINDVYGHDGGDFVLRTTADILRDCTGQGAVVARVGGDEFAIFFPDAPDEADLSQLAQILIDRASQPILYQGNLCRYGISIGISVAEGSDDNGKSLFVNADIALYRAKHEGRGRFCFFRKTMRTQALANKQKSDEILAGIERDEFFCVYQPQFCARSLAITGVEALVRWCTPKLGILNPSDFLATAEELNVLVMIDRMVLRKSVADFRHWAAQGVTVPRMSVNLSQSRLRDPNLPRELASLGLLPGKLSLELLESNFLDDQVDVVSDNILAARAAGLEIEVDDFGTGHTSIVSLLRLKPDRLKIDRALVEHVVGSVTQVQLLKSIVEIGHVLGIRITAEGVETDSQVKILQDIGCDELQGYALARPMMSADLVTFCRGHQVRTRAGAAS